VRANIILKEINIIERVCTKMEKSRKSWYETDYYKDFVKRTSREAPRSFLWNLWTPRVMVGKASVGFLSTFLVEQFEEDERRVLIIVDPYLEKSGIRVQKSLNARGFECKIWKGVQPEVPFETIKDAVRICNDFKPKILFAVGGGSTLDTAKLTFLFYEKPDIDYYNLIPITPLGLRKKIKFLIAIPTTSGTGSEATFGSVVIDTTLTPPKKIGIASMELLPDVVVLSTEFVEKMPPKLTAGTGADALAHAISAYLSSCHNTISDLLSLDAIRLILEFLPRAYKRGNDLEARERMQIAAFIAGLSIGNSGVTIDHSLGHSLGSLFPVHHGVSVGIFTPYAVQYMSKNTDRYIAISEIFKISTADRSNHEILKDFTRVFKSFLKSLNLPTCVNEIIEPKITKEEYMSKLDQLVNFALDDICTYDSLRVPTKEDFKELFIYAYDGKDIDF
jgi:alcohol dehydrogenase class IV